jgi:hypothetical protein
MLLFTECKTHKTPDSSVTGTEKSAGIELHTGDSQKISALGLDGKKVVVQGYYRLINLNKRPGGEPVYGSRVSIEMPDSSYLLLETHELGSRSLEEQAQFTDQKVKIEATVHGFCNAWGDGTEQTIVGSCLKNIHQIVLIDK